jgi:hypothetical protein
MRLVRVRRRVIDLVVDLHVTAVGHSNTRSCEAVERPSPPRASRRTSSDGAPAPVHRTTPRLLPAPALDSSQPVGARHSTSSSVIARASRRRPAPHSAGSVALADFEHFSCAVTMRIRRTEDEAPETEPRAVRGGRAAPAICWAMMSPGWRARARRPRAARRTRRSSSPARRPRGNGRCRSSAIRRARAGRAAPFGRDDRREGVPGARDPNRQASPRRVRDERRDLALARRGG